MSYLREILVTFSVASNNTHARLSSQKQVDQSEDISIRDTSPHLSGYRPGEGLATDDAPTVAHFETKRK
jgi:hypothetical protein